MPPPAPNPFPPERGEIGILGSDRREKGEDRFSLPSSDQSSPERSKGWAAILEWCVPGKVVGGRRAEGNRNSKFSLLDPGKHPYALNMGNPRLGTPLASLSTGRKEDATPLPREPMAPSSIVEKGRVRSRGIR
ncbi:MAG: hypothetical protein D6812_16640 [Deltaproteobacteria bacterium]|nr:MAG: hypothetical protein D6812_16640 [Deltaproteobacteria bacterium]